MVREYTRECNVVANIHEFEVIGDPRPSQYGFLSDQQSKYDLNLIFISILFVLYLLR